MSGSIKRVLSSIWFVAILIASGCAIRTGSQSASVPPITVETAGSPLSSTPVFLPTASSSTSLTPTLGTQISPLTPTANDTIKIRSTDGWLAWTSSTDSLMLANQWTQTLYVRQGETGKTLSWRVSEDIRQAYFLPVEWVPGTHLLLARKGANCNSCWSWGLPVVTINADTGKIIGLGVASLLTSGAYSFNPKQPGVIVIASGGSRYLLDGMRLTRLDLTTGKKRDLTDASMTAFEPAWSPDGLLIAYAAVRAMPNAMGDGPTLERLLNGCAIYIVNPVNDETRALTHPGDEAMDAGPHWDSTGSRLLYARRFVDHTDIRAVSLDGKTDEWLATRMISPMCNYTGCDWESILKYP